MKLPPRIDHFKANGLDLPLPDVVHEPYFDWLMEVGPTEVAGMGQAPISWRTIASWQSLTGAALSPWDARMLRRLSIDYLAESHAAEDWTRVSPWSPELTEDVRAANERRLRMVLG